jgi:hypothetical protein
VSLALLTIVVGLAVHFGGARMPSELRDITGDALWAMMMVWWVSVVAPTATMPIRATVAYGICVAVETSQLLHTPWLDAVRDTTLGHLVLGSGFDSRDLVAYLAGVVLATLIERGLHRPS